MKRETSTHRKRLFWFFLAGAAGDGHRSAGSDYGSAHQTDDRRAQGQGAARRRQDRAAVAPHALPRAAAVVPDRDDGKENVLFEPFIH